MPIKMGRQQELLATDHLECYESLKTEPDLKFTDPAGQPAGRSSELIKLNAGLIGQSVEMGKVQCVEDIEKIELKINIRVLSENAPVSQAESLRERHIDVEILRTEKRIPADHRPVLERIVRIESRREDLRSRDSKKPAGTKEVVVRIVPGRYSR